MYILNIPKVFIMFSMYRVVSSKEFVEKTNERCNVVDVFMPQTINKMRTTKHMEDVLRMSEDCGLCGFSPRVPGLSPHQQPSALVLLGSRWNPVQVWVPSHLGLEQFVSSGMTQERLRWC